MHLSKVGEEPTFLFWRIIIVPIAKRVGADRLELAAPDFSEVFRGRKNFNTPANKVGRQTLKKQLGTGRKKMQAELFQQDRRNKQVGREDFLTNFSH